MKSGGLLLQLFGTVFFLTFHVESASNVVGCQFFYSGFETMAQLVNDARALHGLPPLCISEYTKIDKILIIPNYLGS